MSTFQEQMHGFPLAQIFVVSVTRLAEPIAFTSMFPYAYYMIKDFGIAGSDAEISKYAGYLASVFAFGQVVSSVFWGRMSDIYGRKLVLIWSVGGTAIALILLGFSSNYSMAFLARFLMGLLNGSGAVSRCVIGEIAPARRHQNFAFLSMPIAWNVGGVFGPWIGGALSYPRENPDRVPLWALLQPLVAKYPYVLPNVIIAAIMLLGGLYTFLFLKETHPELKDRHDRGYQIGQRLLRYVPDAIDEEEAIDELVALLSKESTVDPAGIPWREIMKPKILNPIISYFIMRAHFTVFDEFLPIFVSYPQAESSLPLNLKGGLGFAVEKTGNLLSSSGFFGLAAIVAIYPWINRTFSESGHLKFSLGLFPLLFLILPFVVLFAGTVWADIYLYVFIFIRVMFASSMGPAVMVAVNTHSPPEYVGIINGVANAVSAVAPCITPVIWGYFFSVGQAWDCAWLGWWSLAALTLFGFVQGFFIEIE